MGGSVPKSIDELNKKFSDGFGEVYSNTADTFGKITRKFSDRQSEHELI
jgi:hypothetical protein